MEATGRNSVGKAGVDGQTRAPGWAMSGLAKVLVLFVSLLGLGAWGGNAMAVTITSTATGGLWSAATTWVGGVVPTTQNVVIATTSPNAVTLGANTTFAPIDITVPAITISAGSTLSLGAFRLRLTGATSIWGTINLGTSVGNRFTGLVMLNTGAVWTATTATVDFRGGLTNNGTTFTAGTGAYTVTTAAQAFNGSSPIAIPSLDITAVALTNNANLTVATALSGTGSLVNGAAGTLNIGGTSAITTLNAATAGNTVNYTGAAQTVKATPYSNLGLGGSLAKTLTGVTTVGGNLTMSGTATATAAAALTVGGSLTIGATNTFANGANALNVAGNFAQNGIFTAGAGVVTLNGGAAVQTISGTGLLGFVNLTVINTGGITLARNVTVANAIIGAVTLTSTCPVADYTLTSNGGATVVHSCNQPLVTSINLASVNPTVAASVNWTVTFNQSMTGVSTSNFTLVNGGLGGAPAITLVSGSGTTWTVTASTGTGTGTLGLNMTNVTGIIPAVITPMPFTGQVYSVRPPPPVIYYHDTTAGVNIGFDGLTNVTGVNQIIPPIITASLNPVSTCPFTSARSASHPVGLYTHSRWYLNANYAVATNISANPTGSASLRGVAVTDTVVVSLYDYDPVLGGKTLIGSSPVITLTGGGTTTTYLYTITSALYTVPAGHRLMLEYNFNQPLATNNARVYCSAIASFISVTETPVPIVPVAEYRMDEGSWNGTANEVADSSVNALHGSALLGATPATAKICNGANLLANYVEVPDNALLDITNTLTVTAWIKPARWGGAPGKDALMSFLSKDDNYEAHITSTGTINWWWGTGSIMSAATAPVGAWTHVAMVYASGSQTLYVNGVSSATGIVAGALPVNAMPFQIGNDQEFGGGTRRFDGMIDEVKIFNVALTPAQISAGYANENAGNNWDGTARVCVVYAPHHFEIQHASGTGVTCTPSTLTIKACADNAVPCTPYTSGVSGTLSATGAPTVNWSGGTGFTIAAGSSTVTKGVQVTTQGSVVFDATSTPAPTAVTTCDFGAPSCTFTSSDSGLLFDVPHHVSENLQNITVSAVKKADNSLACVPAFGSVSKNVNFTCAYTNPASGTLPVRVGGLALNAGNNAGAACDGAGQALSLAFNASGVAGIIAPITVQYADVGNMTLSAQYTGSGADAGLVMTGTDIFIAAPALFAFSAITAAPIKAGTSFSATVTAKNSAGNTTPNFGQEGEGVTLTRTKYQPTGAGASNGSFSGSAGAFSGGAATASDLIWSEVGTIDLTATLTSGNYLTSGVVAATGTTGVAGAVGPFVPHHFETIVTQGCSAGSYSYSGQPFTVQVNAMNGAIISAVTVNYDGTAGTSPNFAKAVTLSDGNAAGVGVLAPTAVAVSDFTAGSATMNTPAYTFTSRSTAQTAIKLRAVDADASSSGFTEGTTDIRSGRAKLGNAYGSELLNLPIPFRTEYWNNGWIPHSSDSCTGDVLLGASNAVSVTLSASPVTCVQDSGNPGLSGIMSCAVAGPVAQRFKEGATPSVGFAGDFNLWLRAPGAGNTGAVTVTGNAPTWLQYPWGGGAAINPTARATFGVYKGRNEFIYMRENY